MMEHFSSRLCRTSLVRRINATHPSLTRYAHRPVCVAPTTASNQRSIPPEYSEYQSFTQRQWMAAVIAVSAFGYSTYCSSHQAEASSPTSQSTRDPHPEWQAGDRVDQPTFSRKQVSEHNNTGSLWLTYRHGLFICDLQSA